MNVSDLINLLEIRSIPLGGPRTLAPLDADELMAKASSLSGLNDFHCQGWEEGFRSYISLFDENPHLGIIDRLMMRAEILRQLSRRLSLVSLLESKHDAANEPIETPVFITGSPRTGTSILFELLFQDQKFIAPLDSEVRLTLLEEEKNNSMVNQEVEALKKANPGLTPLHEIRPDLPAECTLIMGVSLAYALKNDGESVTWVNEDNLKDAYLFHRKTLQLLQHQKKSKKRWLLKSPYHIFSMTDLLEAYPDAKIIYIHRDQSRAMSSLQAVYRSLFLDFHDSHDANGFRKEVALWSAAHESVIKLRKANKSIDQRIYDLRFADLITDPIAAIEGIYNHLEMDLTDKARYRIALYAKNKPRFKYGKYKYNPEDFGLTRAEISEKFQHYYRHYGISEEA